MHMHFTDNTHLNNLIGLGGNWVSGKW